MKGLILSGFMPADALKADLESLLREAMTRRRWSLDVLNLSDMEIAPCLGCFGCWIRTPGECIVDDDAHRVARQVMGRDLLILLSPIRFGGWSVELKKALDRMIPLISPQFMKIDGEVHHRPRYRRYPALAAVGVLETADDRSSGIFTELVTRNAINLHCPTHAVAVVHRGMSATRLREAINGLFDQLGGTS